MLRQLAQTAHEQAVTQPVVQCLGGGLAGHIVAARIPLWPQGQEGDELLSTRQTFN